MSDYGIYEELKMIFTKLEAKETLRCLGENDELTFTVNEGMVKIKKSFPNHYYDFYYYHNDSLLRFTAPLNLSSNKAADELYKIRKYYNAHLQEVNAEEIDINWG
ncbi:hypothetical protein V1503_06080 [Bacillus sp. SCS-151]|uniref:hypothetical protein n=1 Tax=Nanhaiella sioensis TaxID=3115293 RepID=UPI0039787247